MVDLKVVDDEDEDDDDNIKLLQKPTENRLVATLTSNKFTISLELIKVILLVVICIVVGLSLAVRKHTTSTTTTTHVEDAQVVPLGDPTLPTELRGNSTEPPAPTDWEYKLVIWDSSYIEDCQATSQQWQGMINYNDGNMKCYCGDSPCNAEIGPDVINSHQPYNPDLNPEDTGSNLYYKVLKYGLVPPDTPCNTCGQQKPYPSGSFESKSSFVNSALKEGLTRDEMFTECDYPTLTRSIKYWQSYYIGRMEWYDLTDNSTGASHYAFTPVEITVGDSLEVVEAEAVSCVMEKLVNRIAEGGWEFIPSPTVDTLYFRRQKV